MKRFVSDLEVFCTKSIFLIAAGMLGCLTYWAVKYMHEFQPDYTQERVVGSLDGPGKNILLFAVILGVSYLIQRLILVGEAEKQRKKLRIFVTADILIIGILGCAWVAGSHIMPYADQYQVYLTAVEFTQDIYRDMEAYFYMCPQQYGLAFLYECVLWIWESYHLIQYFNVIFLMMILCFGYKITEELWESPRAGLYTVLVMNGFLPLFFYINFVYGEMGMIAMSMCAIWAVLRWLKEGKVRYMAVASLTMILAILVRQNMIIVTIALAIILVITALKKKNFKAVLLACLLFVLPVVSIKGIEYSYELRSGIEVGGGIPNIMVVAMGMQQSWQGAGAYNAYNHTTFWNEGGGDTQKAAEIAWEYIRGRIEEMAGDLPSTRYFYQSKIWEQWNEGSFGSLFMTSHFEKGPFPPAQYIYGTDFKFTLIHWMDKYLFAIYLASFICSVYGLVREKDIRKTIFPLIVIGGMIFSLLWENKSRYVFPYIVMSLPCMAVGIHLCHLYLEKTSSYLITKVKLLLKKSDAGNEDGE